MLVRFCFLFRIGKFDGLAVDAAQYTVQAGDGSGVAALTQFDPKHNQTGVGVPAAHILDELDLGVGVLVGMAVRAMRSVCQGLKCTVILLTPPVDVLSAGLVADGSLCYAVIERIRNYYLLKPHVLCYLTHSE